MKKRISILFCITALVVSMLCGCTNNKAEKTQTDVQKEENVEEKNRPADAYGLADGEYQAKFETDSSMFHVNEAYHDMGVLTVKDGEMTIHVTLAGTGYTKLYVGKADEAAKTSENILEPTTDKVTYDDGSEEEVYGFDIPVTVLDKEFDIACYGPKKDKWYDHVVSISIVEEEADTIADGEYTVALTMEGGSGKASINSPVSVTVKDGIAMATLVWSSENYDYMIVDGEKYLNQAAEGEKSTFVIPIKSLNGDMTVIGDTTAMSQPHEIEYTLHFTYEE